MGYVGSTEAIFNLMFPSTFDAHVDKWRKEQFFKNSPVARCNAAMKEAGKDWWREVLNKD